jgi:hypothetical protein
MLDTATTPEQHSGVMVADKVISVKGQAAGLGLQTVIVSDILLR